MKSTLMRLNFNGGELSPFLDGRIDFPKYTSGAKEMTNFVPTIYGPMTKRPGTRFVEDLPSNAILYPFEFSETQAYILAFVEAGDATAIQFYTGDGRMLSESTSYALVRVTNEDGSKEFLKVEAEDESGTLEQVRVKSDGDYTLYCPFYTLEQAAELKFAQAGDIIYFTHQDAGMVKVSRIASDEFEIEQFIPSNGPFQDENTDEDLELTFSRIENSANTFVIYIEAPSDTFTEDSVGASIQAGYIPATKIDTWYSESGDYDVGDYLQLDYRIYIVTAGSGETGTLTPLHEKGSVSDGNLTLKYISDGYGYAEITKYLSATKVKAIIKKTFPPYILNAANTSTYSTDAWYWSSFGGEFGWPNAIVFHQQRMVLGGSSNQPQTVWGSVSGDVENFAEGTDDDSAYEFTLAANKKNPISWLASNISLSIGTLGSEFTMTSSGSSITPTDVSIEQIGQYGSTTTTAPLIANGYTLFVQSGGSKLRELRYDYNSERNYARDLNKTAEHINTDGISQISYQSEPYQVVWALIGEELFALTYETDEDVYAWSRQSCGNVQSIATIPNGGNDRLWMVVERNGSYYIEYLTKFYRRTDSLDDAVFVDSSLSYEGDEVQTITGLDHLEGETVNVLNNGSVESQNVVSDGQITLTSPTTKCTIGLPIESAWQSMRFEGGAQDGVGQGKAKKVSKVIFRLEKTGAGFRYGKGNTDKEFEQGIYSEVPVRNVYDNMDHPPVLLDGDTERLPQSGGSDSQYMLRIEHSAPVPCTVIAAMITLDTAQ